MPFNEKPFIIALANEKGGVAKTTSTLSLGAGLVEAGYKTLLIDLDTQANLTIALGFSPEKVERTLFETISNSVLLGELISETGIPNLDFVPSNAKILDVDAQLSRVTDYQNKLQQVLRNQAKKYDFVLIDCPPHLGALTYSALVAGDLLIMPTQAEYFSIYALRNMMAQIKEIREKYNPNLTYRLLMTQFDGRNKIHRTMSDHLHQVFGLGVFQSIIEMDTKLRESQIAGLPIIFHSPKSRAAMQYRALSQEIITYAKKTN
jgi:chromosome partitioning protein